MLGIDDIQHFLIACLAPTTAVVAQPPEGLPKDPKLFITAATAVLRWEESVVPVKITRTTDCAGTRATPLS
jgi:hypothetical protein